MRQVGNVQQQNMMVDFSLQVKTKVTYSEMTCLNKQDNHGNVTYRQKNNGTILLLMSHTYHK